MKKFLQRLGFAMPIAILYAFACIYTGMYRLPFLVALLAFSFMTLWDYYRLASRSLSHKPFKYLGLVFSAILVMLYWNEALKALPDFADLPLHIKVVSMRVSVRSEIPLAIILVFVFTALIAALLRGYSDGAIYAVSTTVFGVLYTTVPISHVALLLTLPDALFYGWLVSWCTFMGDTSAYIAGKCWGKTPLGIFASPHKTLEGYVGGAGLAIVFAELFYIVARTFFVVPQLSLIAIAGIAIGIYALTIVGDLVESLIKRDGERKDSGNYLGDHGGLLDVVDSFLLTLPLSYFWLRVWL